jgi:hypothetical protein
MNVLEQRTTKPNQSQAGRPLTVTVEGMQLLLTSGMNQERPWEGGGNLTAIPGRPAKGRLAGPTCRRLISILCVEVK